MSFYDEIRKKEDTTKTFYDELRKGISDKYEAPKYIPPLASGYTTKPTEISLDTRKPLYETLKQDTLKQEPLKENTLTTRKPLYETLKADFKPVTETNSVMGYEFQRPTKESVAEAKSISDKEKELDKLELKRIDDEMKRLRNKNIGNLSEVDQKVYDNLIVDRLDAQAKVKPIQRGIFDAATTGISNVLGFEDTKELGTKDIELTEAQEIRLSESEQELKESAGYKTGYLGTKFVGTAAQYGVVNSAIGSSKVGAWLTEKLGSKFVATQAVDLLADVIIQTPVEAMEIINSDGTLGDFAKKTAINRGVDIALNLLMGVGSEVLQGKKALKAISDSGNAKMIDDVIAKMTPEQSKLVRETLKTDIPLSPTMKDTTFYDELRKVEQPKLSTFEQATKDVSEGKLTPEYPSKDRLGQLKTDTTKVETPIKTDIPKVEPTKLEPLKDIQGKTVDIDGNTYKIVGEDGNNYKAITFTGEETFIPKVIADKAKILNDDELLTSQIKSKAQESIYNLNATVKGEQGFSKVDVPESKFIKGETGEVYPRTKRLTTDDIATFLDNKYASSYADLEKKLNNIVNGKKPTKNEREMIEYFTESIKKNEVKSIIEPPKKVELPKVKKEVKAPEIKKVTPKVKTVEPPKIKKTMTIAEKAVELPKLKNVNMKKDPTMIIKMPEVKKVKTNTRINEPDISASTLKSHLAEGDEKTALDKIIGDTKKTKKSFKQLALDVHKHSVDMLTPFKTLEQNVTGSKKLVTAENSLYKTAINSAGAPTRAEELIRTNLEPILKQVEKDGFSMEQFQLYSLMKHAEDVNAANMKSGFSDAEIKTVLDKYSGTKLEKSRKELMSFQNGIIKEMYDGDLISKESFYALNNKWKNYMPLSRVIDDEKVEFLKGMNNSFNNPSNNLNALKGSDKSVKSPIESILNNVYKTQDSISKNAVGVQLAELAKLDVDGSFIRKLEVGEEIGRKNVVTVSLGGEPVKFEVEPDVFKTFNNMDKESSNLLLKILQKPASILRLGATTTMEFATRNPFKDIQDAFMKAESGFNPFTDFAAGLMSTIKKDQWYSDFMKSSGGYGNFLSPDQHAKNIKSMLKQSPVKNAINIVNPMSYVKLISSISNATETATKVGVFRKAVKKGVSLPEAAYQARSIMDFSRAGSSVKEANKVIAFLNAPIQGKSTLIRAIKDNPKKVLTRIGAISVLPTVGISANNYYFASDEQKKRIAESPDWLKATAWQVAIPGTDIIARLPKAFETAVISNGVERALDALLLDDKEAFEGYIGQSVKDIASIPIMMTGLTGLYEGASNYSQFRQGPIIPQREKNLQSKDQFDSATSEAAKGIAGVIGALTKKDGNFASPRIIDYMLKSSTGGLGTTALNSMDWLLDKTGIVDKPVKAKKDVTQLPLLKGWLVNSSTSAKSVGDLYDLKTELTKEKGSLKLSDSNFDKQPLLTYVTRETGRISDISKEIRTVTESKTLTAEEKRIEIDRLIKMRNNVGIEAMKKYKKNE